MPDERRWVKADLPAALAHLPAQVDIVACRRVYGIEPANFLQHLLPESHIAAGDVLGPVVPDEHMDGSTGRPGHLLGARAVVDWGYVGATVATHRPAIQAQGEVVRPFRAGVGIAVEVRDDLAPRGSKACVSCRGKPRVLDLEQPRARVAAGDRGGVVGRAVVDDDHV